LGGESAGIGDDPAVESLSPDRNVGAVELAALNKDLHADGGSRFVPAAGAGNLTEAIPPHPAESG
jgi:hypothetical protein